MISSSDVLSAEDPIFWGSNGGETILVDWEKSKNWIEHHWTSDKRYMIWVGLEYISVAFGGDLNQPLCLLAIRDLSPVYSCKPWAASAPSM